jgi:hypothetical protein
VAEPPKVLLDLNNPIFQDDLFSLGKEDANRILQSLRRLRQLNWSELYADKGLRWELIQSKAGPGDKRLYTLRVSGKFRAVVCRDGQFLRFLSLHPDHDSAYR